MEAEERNAIVRQAIRSARHSPRGLTTREADAVDYLPSGDLQRLSGGLLVVHLRQHHLGIPLLHAGRSVRFDPDGSFQKVTGRPTAIDPALPTVPALDAVEATHAACSHVSESGALKGAGTPISTRRPSLVAELNDPTHTAVLRKRPFRDPIVARLTVFGEGSNSALAWEIRLRPPGPYGPLAVFVDAGKRRSPRVLECLRMSAHAVASGPVYEFNPGESSRVTRSFPPDRAAYPGLWNRSMPDTGWVDSDATSGNNAASLDHENKAFNATVDGGASVFAPSGLVGEGQVNAFYLVNYLHDFFQLLGFDESLGNFQRRNTGGSGKAGDAVRVTVWPRPFDGLADFVSKMDGFPPELNLGPADTSQGMRHSALDADIVIHEYSHGVSNRLIGGPRAEHPLVKLQSRALGEGFSDYFALSLQNYLRRRAGRAEVKTFGGFVNPDKSTGLRNQSYGSSFPGSYGSLGQAAFQKAHDAGTVWCEALLRVNAALASAGDPSSGDELGWQIVFDSLRLLHPGSSGPTYLHARDAVLTALENCPAELLTGPRDDLRLKMVSAFASMGMGPGATSSSADFGGIHEDFGGLPS
jgi:extracellular elastinolytic metalloproteinase